MVGRLHAVQDWNKFFVGGLKFLFTLLMLPLTLLLAFYSTFLNKDFYIKDVAAFAYTFATEKLPSNEGTQYADVISKKDFEQVIKNVYNEKDFSDFFAVAYSAVENDLSNVVDGKLSLHIPLDFFKGRQESIVSAMSDILYARIPVCADKVVPKNFECIPKGLAKPDFTSKLRSVMDKEMFSKIPNVFDVNMLVPVSSDQNLWNFAHNAFYCIFIAGFLIGLIFLILIGLVVRKPWTTGLAVKNSWIVVLKVEAETIFLLSFLLLVFAAGLYFFTQLTSFQDYMQNNQVMTDDSNQFVLGFLFKSFAEKLLWYVLPAFVLSLAGMIYSMFFPIKKSHES